ncbi:MAG: ATP-binding protein, partial [Lachnospiraceae bacterium]|nr:ATP-binding protein [Lachnospiraceae bacterium]
HLLQEQLKSTIRYLAPDNVKEYTIYWNEESKQLENLDAFESMLTNDIKRLLEKEWQESAKMSPAQKLFYLHQDFACHKSSIFGGRNWFLDRCLWHLNNGTRQILIYGETGSGKTTALGALFSFLQKSGWQTLPFFTGIHGHTDTSSSLFNYLIWQIEELTRESHQADGHTFSASLNEKIQYLNSLITKYTQMKTMPLAILIDNADSLNCLQQLFSLSSHKVAILCSSSSCYHERNMDVKTIELYSFGKRKKDSIPDFLKPFHLGLKEQLESSNPFAQDDGVIPDDASQHLAYELENLFEAGIPDDDILLEKKAVIEGILKYHKKELDSRVINAIVEKNEADTPLYLSILIQRLIMMDRKDFYKISELGDGIDNITAYQLQLIQDVSLTTSQLCVWLMNAAIEKIGNPALKDALYFLSITHVGLCENDLESLILLKYNSWNALDFTLFIRYMGVAFIQYNDGRYTFANDMLRKGFLQDCENIADFHKILLEYIKTLPSEHSLRTKESIIHCYMANDKEFFLQHLTEYQHNSTSHIFTMEDLCHLLQNGSFLHSEPDIYHWVAKSFEAAESKAQCLMLIRYLAPYAKQVFFQDNMFDHTLPLFESLVKLAEKSTDVYHISWMLTVYAENILNHRSDFCVPMPDGSIPTPLINAKEACLKAAELLSQEPTHSDELTQCYALGGEIAAVSGLYSEAFQFFEHAEYYSRQYTNIEKQKELIAHFLENQGDMLLFTCEPSNKLLALQKYQAVQADIEREPRILAKCYLCV